jgi:D-arabinose 1-dehydrogenase-like Zn-dependent alcohol dehydrogenase
MKIIAAIAKVLASNDLGGRPVKAAVVPAVSSSWQIQDVPQPQPGPNRVLVKMHASGICYTEVHQTLGHLPGQFPRILGHERVGEIVAVAPDVTTRKVGDRVGQGKVKSTIFMLRCDRDTGHADLLTTASGELGA